MNTQYIEFDGKHPASKKENRHYSNKPNSRWVSYGCKYSDDFFKLDIDDYDHESYKLEEPIKSKPRSEAVISLLDSLNIKYNGIRTEYGVHLFFRVPAGMQKKTIPPWYSVIGIKCEWKFPASDDHIPLQINNVKRNFFKGSIDNTDIDELPFFLYPLQKSKERPYDITFPRGSRTQELGGYLFHLISKDMKGLHITPEQAFKVVEYMNFYVFDEPIPKDSLNTQILNESTFEKLKENQKEASGKKLSHVDIGDEIIDRYNVITVNGDFYSYENGVYKPFEEGKLKSFMSEKYPTAKINMKREVIDYIKGKTYQEAPQSNETINVKNGIISISNNGEVLFSQHSPEIISLKQFNATYKATKSEKHYRFTDEEITTMWNWSKNNEYIQVILMLIYSGVRPGELFKVKKCFVNLEEKWFYIEKGKNDNAARKVPIHDKVFPFFEYWYNKNDSEYLITQINGKPIKFDTNHGQYTESYWKPLLVDMGILTYTNDKGEEKEHTPDDTRHTFTTMWKEKKLDEAFRRKIQGHSGKGIGEIVYTHLEFAKLLEELNKL